MQSVFSDMNSMIEKAQKYINQIDLKIVAINSRITTTTLARDKIQSTLDLFANQRTLS